MPVETTSLVHILETDSGIDAWHEQKAWERFLVFARDEAAAQTWLGDRYSGPA